MGAGDHNRNSGEQTTAVGNEGGEGQEITPQQYECVNRGGGGGHCSRNLLG